MGRCKGVTGVDNRCSGDPGIGLVYALGAISVARILGAVSSVTDSKISVHVKVVEFEEVDETMPPLI
jgi:hypothetical protein